MPNLSLVLVIILALMLWRSVYAILYLRNVFRETAQRHPRHDRSLLRRFRFLERAFAGAIEENGSDTGTEQACLSDPTSRAKAYLRRIVSLTGAKPMGDRYVLNVGKTTFHVRERFVWRLPDSANPGLGYNRTCFYSVHAGMPRDEEIASVLLQLKSNPALFDDWVRKNGQAFRADGRMFTAPE